MSFALARFGLMGRGAARAPVVTPIVLTLVLFGCGEGTISPHRDGGLRDGAAPSGDAFVDPGTDGDGDTITDVQEGRGAIDTDGDGVPDDADDDSDGDGLLDRDEAGDADPRTPPLDTDADGRPNFQDLDSDGDGLPDADEVAAGTDPLSVDSDADGVGDLVEVAAGTNPLDGTDSPRTRGDFFFVVPYASPPEPPRDTLVFGTDIQRADIHFMIDTSISMQAYIDTVRTSLTTVVVPGVTAAIPDVAFGVGQFDVCPESTHRPGICRGIEQNLTSTTDAAAVATALGTLTADCSPVHEPYAQSMWVWATGDTSRWPLMTPPTCAAGAVGLGCVRPGALPILVMIGDEPYAESFNVAGAACATPSCATCASFPAAADILSAFAAIRGRVVVLGATGTSAEWAPIVTGTGSVGSTGAPLIFSAAGSATVDAQIVDAISELATNTPLDITARARDVDDGPGDGVDATVFIERIEPNTTGGVADPTNPLVICVGGLSTSDVDLDGRDETFTDVTPGVPVCFDIIARRNDTVVPSSAPQVFRAQIDVVGDGITVLDTRDVYFLVPSIDGTNVPL
jgi:hypothetical protein